MRLRQRHWESHGSAGEGYVRVLSPLGVAFILVLAVFAAGASAAPAARSSRAASSSLCSVSKAVASNIVHSTAIKPGQSPTYLKTFFNKITAAEPKLLAAASGSLKTDLHKVFGFINTLVADLKKVNWNIVGLAPYEKTLLAEEAKIKPQLAALKHYYNTSCKFHV